MSPTPLHSLPKHVPKMPKSHQLFSLSLFCSILDLLVLLCLFDSLGLLFLCPIGLRSFEWRFFVGPKPFCFYAPFHFGPKLKKNKEKVAIQSFTFPRMREWAQCASETTSERSGAREYVSEASERVSSASEQANGRVSGPVLQSGFLVILAHSAFFIETRKS